jgi:ATP-binding cassette subfamily C protein/ATP-binding cassette subfamily C protein LapB
MASQEVLEQAAEKAGILDDINALPEGFDTRIGDKTLSKFPPGFTRALSIARAFCRKPQLVLLDEPGASLDNESDMRFMEQLKKLKGEHTVVMVSHRPSHIRIADKAVLLDQGSVKFVGDPEKAIELMMGEE